MQPALPATKAPAAVTFSVPVMGLQGPSTSLPPAAARLSAASL